MEFAAHSGIALLELWVIETGIEGRSNADEIKIEQTAWTCLTCTDD